MRNAAESTLDYLFITLVTHLVMKSCYDIKWKGTGQNQLLEDTMSLVCLSAIENPVPQEQM